ncbi:MAG TPA: hypothetical protein VMZ91_11295 [Candidatus Paceibacterota bacterium]|nr:hypothetical protein [Candidatus Paceibacterota bacterium]
MVKQQVEIQSIKFTPIYEQKHTAEKKDYTHEEAKAQWAKLKPEDRKVLERLKKKGDIEKIVAFLDLHELPSKITMNPETKKPQLVEP